MPKKSLEIKQQPQDILFALEFLEGAHPLVVVEGGDLAEHVLCRLHAEGGALHLVETALFPRQTWDNKKY